MLTQEQLNDFNEQGFCRLSGAFCTVEAQAMEDLLWDVLGKKHGVARDDKSTWQIPLGAGLRSLQTHNVFKPIGGPTLRSALDDLIGAGVWAIPGHWGSLLVSFPQFPGAKSRANFHTDFPYTLPSTQVVGAVVFAFLSHVPANTGGTLVVAGSHKLVAKFIEAKPHLKKVKMKVTRQALLGSDPYLRALCGGWTEEDWVTGLPMEEHTVAGTRLQVTELTGDAGEVVVAHPWLLHSGSPNRGNKPRFMSVQRIRSG